jgi:hypothetical protein
VGPRAGTGVLGLFGAVPFAAAAWWTVVIPFTGILMLAIGIPHFMRGSPHSGSASPAVG